MQTIIDSRVLAAMSHPVRRRLLAWQAHRDSASREWTDAAFSTDAWLHLTPAELSQLSEEITGLLHRWRDRTSAGAEPASGAEGPA